MPRVIAPENLDCPPIRALTFDSLGLIKVTEARGKGGNPTVVNTWGETNASRTILAASINDRFRNPLLAVARKDGNVEVLNPCNGDLHVAYSAYGDEGCSSDDNEISALHLFRKEKEDQAERSCTLLTCTKKGDVSLRSVQFPDAHADSTDDDAPKTWKACGSGEILVGKVDGSENFTLFGGNRVEINIWDLEQCIKIWSAKSPPKDNLGIFTPTWFTCATFLSNNDHRKFVTGTKSHQVRLYDISAQRRPVLSFDFLENAITSIAEDPDGHTIYVGNAAADLASFDMRTGQLVGNFLGKCSGSIRSIVRHPQYPVIACCGLDRYLRIYDVKSRQPISAVFLKQHLTGLVLDSGYTGGDALVEAATEENITIMDKEDDETEKAPVKAKKSKKEKRIREKVFDVEDDEEEDKDETEKAPVKTKKSKKEKRSREKDSEGEEKDELRTKKTREQKKKTKKVKVSQED